MYVSPLGDVVLDQIKIRMEWMSRVVGGLLPSLVLKNMHMVKYMKIVVSFSAFLSEFVYELPCDH